MLCVTSGPCLKTLHFTRKGEPASWIQPVGFYFQNYNCLCKYLRRLQDLILTRLCTLGSVPKFNQTFASERSELHLSIKNVFVCKTKTRTQVEGVAGLFAREVILDHIAQTRCLNFNAGQIEPAEKPNSDRVKLTLESWNMILPSTNGHSGGCLLLLHR